MKRIVTLFITALFISSSATTAVGAISAAELQMIRGNFPYYFNYESCNTTTNTTGVASSIRVGGQIFNLPAARGFTGYESAIDETGKYVDRNEFVKYARYAKIGQEYRDYFITMRWTTHKWFWGGDPPTGQPAQLVDAEQEEWLGDQPRFVIVTNAKTVPAKSIVAAVLEAGPAPYAGVDTQANDIPKQGWKQPQLGTPPGYSGRVSGLPPKAIEYLGAVQRDGGQTNGDELYYAWHPDQDDAVPGPTDLSAITTGPETKQCLPEESGGAGVSPDGFVFPLRTTKDRLKNNPYWSPRCKNKVSRMGQLGSIAQLDGLCHHDYLAADIQTPAGTKVLAPRPGVVLRSGASNNKCISHNLNVYSDPALGGDGNTYYFAHLSAEDQASKGQVVKAGDVIGTIDEGHGCFQSHLHFDISPTQASFGRGDYGTKGPLFDPQPPLVAAYNNLPEN